MKYTLLFLFLYKQQAFLIAVLDPAPFTDGGACCLERVSFLCSLVCLGNVTNVMDKYLVLIEEVLADQSGIR